MLPSSARLAPARSLVSCWENAVAVYTNSIRTGRVWIVHPCHFFRSELSRSGALMALLQSPTGGFLRDALPPRPVRCPTQCPSARLGFFFIGDRVGGYRRQARLEDGNQESRKEGSLSGAYTRHSDTTREEKRVVDLQLAARPEGTDSDSYLCSRAAAISLLSVVVILWRVTRK